MSELNRNQESSSTPLSSSAKKCSEYVLVSRKELAMLKREVRICTHYMAELSSHPTRKSLNYIKQKLAASKPIELHSQNNGEISKLQDRLQHLKAENEGLRTERVVLTAELQSLKALVKNEASESSKIGSALGYFLWNASTCEQAVEKLVSCTDLSDLINLASIHVQDLLQKVNQEHKHWLIGADNTYQVLHVAYLIGFLANICAAEQGKLQLLQNAKISELTGNLCRLVECGPVSCLKNPKSFALCFLLNLSLNPKGCKLILDNDKVLRPKLKEILRCNVVDTTVKTTTCQLIYSLLQENRSSFFVNQDTLKFVAETAKSEELKNMALDVLEEMNKKIVLTIEDYEL